MENSTSYNTTTTSTTNNNENTNTNKSYLLIINKISLSFVVIYLKKIFVFKRF